jgi:hypothetical protein
MAVREDINGFQRDFMANFIFRCLYRPEITPSLLNLGVKKQKYKTTNLEENIFELIKAIKETSAIDDSDLRREFEVECKSIGFDTYSKKMCLIF